jgi:ADP-ribose pyrophosphatase YjhB (NUDIX family)
MEKKVDAVQVVLINGKGEVLAVSRKDNHSDFGLPGGKVESQDNSLIMAAIRETKEETGIHIYNLELIYAAHSRGRMGYTYLAECESETINYNKEMEPHVVKWTNYQEVIDGKFGEWNKQVYKSLLSKGIKVKL